jgi:hypothetical protein
VIKSSNSECQHLCLTPTRNEAWIIKPFLAAARQWANHIIVADQGSTDETPQACQNVPGVKLVINDSPVFDERHRQKLLLHHARQVEGKRILIALDADEALSANVANSAEWKQLEAAAPGTIIRFRWVNILPGFREAWVREGMVPFGYVDDGCPHTEEAAIHNPRLPQPANAPVLDMQDVVVLHFQYVVWERMLSKQRWYQAWERINYPDKSALDIFRKYNHMQGSWGAEEISPVRPEWFAGYQEAGIDFSQLRAEEMTWWDREIMEMLQRHGPQFFRRIALWDRDWDALGVKQGLAKGLLADPRSAVETRIHTLLKSTQNQRERIPVRGLEWMLRRMGW